MPENGLQKQSSNRPCNLTLLLYVLSVCACVLCSLGQAKAQIVVSQDLAHDHITIQWPSSPNTPSYQIMLDDTPVFQHPMVSTTRTVNHILLNTFAWGLAPGVTYYVMIQPGSLQTTFRLNVQPWTDSYLTYSYAQGEWAQNRGRVSTYSGMDWKGSSWVLNTSWPDAKTLVAPDAYDLEYHLRSAVNMAAVRNDYALLDELARFFNGYEGRFTTLKAMRALQSSTTDTSMLSGEGADSIRTLTWVITNSRPPNTVRTCYLCTSQFLHPAARLIRIITTLPAAHRTANMDAFVSWYAPLIIHDHLMNLFYDAPAENWVPHWQAILNGTWQHPMWDLHLWMIAAAAEMLGANANNPTLVPMTPDEQSKLLQAVQVGVNLFEKQRTVYSTTRNFQGGVVGSASYFNGDNATSSEYAYSGYTGMSFPTPSQGRVQPGASWDISHFYRVPVFLRSLYDNRKATGVRWNNFPTTADVQSIINQYMYRVFQGNFSRPLFNNYFDGSNGWFRVGYHGSTFGYPPTQYCNGSDCLTDGALQGWGMLAFFSPDLLNLQHSLLTLAWSVDSSTVAFRDQYYGPYYKFRYPNGYPYNESDLLFWVLAGVPEQLQP
jgi:hypothetical protein